MQRKVAAEFFGTALLLLAVAGSGVMGESLASGNAAVALLANSLATGAGLYVIISLLGPVSGAHLNPVVTLMSWAEGEFDMRQALAYVAAQVAGAVAGVWAVHGMFGLRVLQLSTKSRATAGLWLSEVIATALLLLLVRTASGRKDEKLPAYVALAVTAGYWATSSTFFVNPAATIARSLTDTFVGIRPADAGPFVLAQLVGLGLVLGVARMLRC
jgi:glycerol uptake facilitator-like aquaporin